MYLFVTNPAKWYPMKYVGSIILLSAICLVPTTNVIAQESGTVISANMAADTVELFDAATREKIATLESGPAPHEVAVSGSGEWAIVTNYGNRQAVGSSLSLINIPEARIQDRFELGLYQRPHGVFFLPGDTLVAVTSETRGVVLFLDVRSGDIVDTVATTQRTSHMLAASLTGKEMFTTNIVDGTVTEIDGIERTRGRVIEVAPRIEGIALSPQGDRAWIGSNANKSVYVVDVESGSIEKEFTDFGFPYRMAVSSDNTVAVLCDPGKSEIRFIDAKSLDLIKIMPVSGSTSLGSAEFTDSASPEGLVITPNSKYAYVSLQGLNQVLAIDLSSLEETGRFDTGEWPDGIGYSPLMAGKNR